MLRVKRLKNQFKRNPYYQRIDHRFGNSDRHGLDVPKRFEDFARKCRIRSGTQFVPFELYDYQLLLSDLIDKHRGVVVFKTRQIGATAVIPCKLIHKACLNPAYSAGVISMGQKETSDVAKRCRVLPSGMANIEFDSNSLTNLSIKGGGQIRFAPATDNALRGADSVWDIFYDEAGFIKKIDELYAGASPSQDMVGDAARTIIVSTMPPEGTLSWFWEMFSAGDDRANDLVRKAKETGLEWWVDPESGWAKVIIHWKSHPVYSQITDYLADVKKKRKLTEDKLQREYNLEIPESGGLLFDLACFHACATGQWQPPVNGKKYLCGIDPSYGGKDYFVLQIWDITSQPYQLVHEYRANEKSISYYQKQAIAILSQYNPSLVAIEANDGGGKALLESLAAKLPGLRFEKVLTTSASKIPNTDRIALAIENQSVKFPIDWAGLKEAHSFASGERSAYGTGTDDSIMCFAHAWAWLSDAVNANAFETMFSTTPDYRRR